MSVYSGLATQIVDFGTNKSNPRTEKVTKITIHHMAMVGADAATVARGHRDGSQQASANYYIGNDGTICGGVSEDRRAWTSSSSWNDQRAITFEVANCKGEPNWEISDKAYRSMIALAADICKRYGITPHFTGDQNGSLTLHCYYCATQCPGSYLKGLHQNGTIEKDIKNAMGGTPIDQSIWDYLSARIGNDYGTAGMMGNMQAESGLKTNNLQNSYEKILGYTDETYTAAVDNGSYTRSQFISDKAGMGLCQWTASGRKAGLYDLKASRGCSIADLGLQLDWTWKELTTSYKGVLNGLKAATSVREASDIVLTKFECPADQTESVKQTRASYSQAFYDKFSGGFKPYIVRVTADVLNVREQPTTDSAIVREVYRGEAYTIVQEQNGWGFLKSGVGWICLSYTERV